MVAGRDEVGGQHGVSIGSPVDGGGLQLRRHISSPRGKERLVLAISLLKNTLKGERRRKLLVVVVVAVEKRSPAYLVFLFYKNAYQMIAHSMDRSMFQDDIVSRSCLFFFFVLMKVLFKNL